MFGYATDETETLMPLTCVLAHQLNEKLAENRRNGVLPYLRPDTKTQITLEYVHDGGAVIPKRVHTIVISTQHSPDVTIEQLRKDCREKIINVRFGFFFCFKNSLHQRYLNYSVGIQVYRIISRFFSFN